jgi:NAD(P)H dehydrogenase (quinone)
LRRQHWLGEQALNWSAYPTSGRRSFRRTRCLWLWWPSRSQNPACFGCRSGPAVAARDVAEAIGAILLDPGHYVGQIVELTGPRSVDLNELAKEYSSALGRPVSYVPVPLEDWRNELSKRDLPDHLS